MTEERVTMIFQWYPLAVEYVPGPPTVTVVGYPALPGENYIDYSRRVMPLAWRDIQIRPAARKPWWRRIFTP